jgi:arsenate reductase
MAEGLLRHLAGDRFHVSSAGTRPVGLNADAVAAMDELGIDISKHRSKHVDEFLGRRFDYVITVCDRAKESCPLFPGVGAVFHWSFEDPASAQGPENERRRIFRKVRDEIAARIRLFIDSPEPGDPERRG